MKAYDLDSSNLMMDVSEIRHRGWTETMIEKLLGESSWVESGWGNSSKKAYRAAHVEAVEAGSQFREKFLASSRRRKLDEAFVGKVLKRSRKLERSGAISVWQKISNEMQIAEEKELEEIKLASQAREAKPQPPSPPPSRLVCSIDVMTIVGELDGSIRFMRHEGIDCVYCEWSPSMKAESQTQGTTAEAVVKLLPQVLTTIIRFSGSVEFTGPGMVDEQMFTKLVDELNVQMFEIKRENMKQADEAILALARELELTPEPSSDSSGIWDAQCPGTKHGLLLNTSRNEFWCGYCNRSGDLDGLRSFVDERRRSDQIPKKDHS